MSIHSPRISVIIPTYQHARTLSVCIKSLLHQTLLPEEIIVVDDGSTDDTREVVAVFGKKVNAVFQENQGAPVARNNGAKVATGELLLFCDADVVTYPSMLKKMSDALITHPEASYVYSGFRWAFKRFPSRLFDPSTLQNTNFIHTTSLLRSAHFPGFDPLLKRFQDWDLWLTLLAQGRRGLAIEEELFCVQWTSCRKGISTWLPSFFYRLPWNRIGWMPKSVREYEAAREIVKRKHHL